MIPPVLLNRILLFIALIPLAACSFGPQGSPAEQACARRVDADPDYHELRIKAANPDWLWQNKPKLDAARQQAISRCLGGPAYNNRGGVEAPN